jgi:hypothetical protein
VMVVVVAAAVVVWVGEDVGVVISTHELR